MVLSSRRLENMFRIPLDEKNRDAPLGTEDAGPGSKFEGGSADSQDQHT